MVNNSENHKLIEKYFREFLPSVVSDSSFSRSDKLNTVLSFNFSDLEVTWTLKIEQGHITGVRSGHTDDNELTFTLDSETFFQIVSGEMSPKESFMKGQTDINGNIIKAFKLSSILERLTSEHPFKACNG